MSKKQTRRKVIRIIVTEEEDDDVKGAGRPNAWWAEKKRQEAEEKEHLTEDPAGSDTFGGSFRATHPVPHGGAAAVRPENTLGSEELCWCGEPLGHDWPGKDKGRKHPKRDEASTMSRQMTGTVDRRDLRGYHAQIQEFIMQCINDNNLSFRIGRNSLLLYPPDNSAPITVYARNTDRQVRQLRKWYVAHVHPHLPAEDETAEVSEEQIKALADAVNDKAEHPQREPEPEPEPEPEAEPEPEPEDDEADEVVPVAPPADAPDSEWWPYIREKDGPSPNIETNGNRYRCKLCIDTDHPLDTDSRRAIGGHNRIYHTDTSNLHGKEARQKAWDTHRANKIRTQVTEAIEVLIQAVDYQVASEDTGKVKELEAEVARLATANQTLTKDLTDLRAEHEEVQAKLALLRETLSL